MQYHGCLKHFLLGLRASARFCALFLVFCQRKQEISLDQLAGEACFSALKLNLCQKKQENEF